jgi:hypothetical protein
MGLRNPKGTSALPLERDAWAFLDAAGITSSRQQEAIITLVRDLKQARLWTKMKAIYPFVGGTATTHKWNLKDPRDVDAAFRLTFVGGWTHSASGSAGNGTNTYADTYLVPKTHLTPYNTHISEYLRNNIQGGYDIASYKGSGFDIMDMGARNGSDLFYSEMYTYPTTYITSSNTDSRGFFTATRTNTTTLKLFKNNVQAGATLTAVASNFTNLTGKTYIGNRTDLATTYTPREFSYISIGDGLTDAEATFLYNCVDRYQKFLGRAV